MNIRKANAPSQNLISSVLDLDVILAKVLPNREQASKHEPRGRIQQTQGWLEPTEQKVGKNGRWASKREKNRNISRVTVFEHILLLVKHSAPLSNWGWGLYSAAFG